MRTLLFAILLGIAVPVAAQPPTPCTPNTGSWTVTTTAATLYVCGSDGATWIVAGGEGAGVPAGTIVVSLATCAAGYEEATELAGKTLVGTLAANKDVGTTGGADDITPAGTNSAPTFTGTPFTSIIDHTHPVTDPGHTHLTQRYPTATGGSSGFTIDTSMSGTLADNTLPTKTATTGVTTANPVGGVASITPAGTVAAPTFTGTQFDNRSAFIRVIFCRKT